MRQCIQIDEVTRVEANAWNWTPVITIGRFYRCISFGSAWTEITSARYGSSMARSSLLAMRITSDVCTKRRYPRECVRRTLWGKIRVGRRCWLPTGCIWVHWHFRARAMGYRFRARVRVSLLSPYWERSNSTVATFRYISFGLLTREASELSHFNVTPFLLDE